MVEDAWEGLRRAVATLGLPVDGAFEARARRFLAELDAWNPVARLTGYATLRDRVDHLLVESLLFLRAMPEPASPVVDIGTGAGVPGIVLQLARPEWVVWFVEANRRRANFVRHALRTLGLDPGAVYQDRAERLGAGPLRGAARTVTLRAVAATARALALGRPFLAEDGHLVVALGSRRGAVPPVGRVDRVWIESGPSRLPGERAFLIIGAAQIDANVPRGTSGGRGTHPGSREPEGRGRQDDHRRQSRGGPRGG